MNTKSELTSISKFLSLVLRHEPELIGLELDDAGWTSVEALLRKAAANGKPITHELLAEIVATSDKQRFAFSADGQLIRANQGHSVEVDLGLPVAMPPDFLFHGTAERFSQSILRAGLERRARHHVHLTQDRQIARGIGRRHGAPVVLRVDARRMAEQGYEFRCSANGVWLVDSVPPEFIQAES